MIIDFLSIQFQLIWFVYFGSNQLIPYNRNWYQLITINLSKFQVFWFYSQVFAVSNCHLILPNQLQLISLNSSIPPQIYPTACFTNFNRFVDNFFQIFIMSTLSLKSVYAFAREMYPKRNMQPIQYGTAGFRDRLVKIVF